MVAGNLAEIFEEAGLPASVLNIVAHAHGDGSKIGDEPQMPFGGGKDSGWGRFGGAVALDEFSELKWVTVQSGGHPYPF